VHDHEGARAFLREALEPLQQHLDKIKYAVVGFEVGENGTPHAQGYISWTSVVSWNVVRDLLSSHAHIEPQKASDDYDSAKYCWKDGDLLLEIGRRPKPGERKDLASLAEAVKAAAASRTPLREVVEAHAAQAIRYYHGMQYVYQACLPPAEQRTKPLLVLIWGTSRSGKNRYIESRWDTTLRYDKNPSSRWWEDYIGQPVVHVEDYHPTEHHATLPVSAFKNLISTSQISVEIKGGRVPFAPKIVIVTSNYDPRQWSNDSGVLDPFLGRVDLCVEVVGRQGEWLDPQVMDVYINHLCGPDYVYSGMQTRQVGTWVPPAAGSPASMPVVPMRSGSDPFANRGSEVDS